MITPFSITLNDVLFNLTSDFFNILQTHHKNAYASKYYFKYVGS